MRGPLRSQRVFLKAGDGDELSAEAREADERVKNDLGPDRELHARTEIDGAFGFGAVCVEKGADAERQLDVGLLFLLGELFGGDEDYRFRPFVRSEVGGVGSNVDEAALRLPGFGNPRCDHLEVVFAFERLFKVRIVFLHVCFCFFVVVVVVIIVVGRRGSVTFDSVGGEENGERFGDGEGKLFENAEHHRFHVF